MDPWVLGDMADLGASRPLLPPSEVGGFSAEPRLGRASAWWVLQGEGEGGLAVRLAHSPGGDLSLLAADPRPDGLDVELEGPVGRFHTSASLLEGSAVLRVTTRLVPRVDVSFPFWPRDLVALGPPEDPVASSGRVRVHQVGPRSGLVYASFDRPALGSLLYLQNLTALNDYCSRTEVSVADSVGGTWPSLGFALPASGAEALEAGEEIVLSDVFLTLTDAVPADETEAAELFLDLLADVYLAMPRPETRYEDWLGTLESSLRDLERWPGCWTGLDGKRFLTAYVGDEITPPESMVQLGVLVPLVEYAGWSGRELPVIADLSDGLEEFFDPDVGSVLRWHPKAIDLLDESEPHRKPRVMDSWYLYHPLLNLSRLAIAGHDQARALFLDSLDYAIGVARHFEYRWPVFFDVDTLEVLRAETTPGEGGEHDVGGAYALVMLQAHELTGEERYLDEARQAADVMLDLGFRLFYQLNDTCFGAGAFLRLWQLTGDEKYRRFSHVCLANVFANAWLWECDYGNAAHHPTFFSLFPLRDAPYVAAYEEVEALGALEDYLIRAGEGIRPSLRTLIPEALRYLVNKGVYYYPPRLPSAILAEAPFVGRIEPTIWIPLEDLRDGWETRGQVGQEVYGAAYPFGTVVRHYLRTPGAILFSEYPLTDVRSDRGSLTFHLPGDPRLTCRIRLVPADPGGVVPAVSVASHGGGRPAGDPTRTDDGHVDLAVPGGGSVTLLLGGPVAVPGEVRDAS